MLRGFLILFKLCLPVSSADGLYKQFGSRSGPAKPCDQNHMIVFDLGENV